MVLHICSMEHKLFSLCDYIFVPYFIAYNILTTNEMELLVFHNFEIISWVFFPWKKSVTLFLQTKLHSVDTLEKVYIKLSWKLRFNTRKFFTDPYREYLNIVLQYIPSNRWACHVHDKNQKRIHNIGYQVSSGCVWAAHWCKKNKPYKPVTE